MRHLANSTQSMCIHQYHFSVAPGDAITNQMFFIQRSLQAAGIGGKIFADHIRGGLAKWIHNFDDQELWNSDLLLLHHSHGNPQLQRLLQVEVPKALVYHNITPEHFFRHDPHMWNLCRIGRRQLKAIRESVVASFVDSRFNADELKTLGFSKPILFPLFDINRQLAEASTTSPSTSRGHRMRRLLFIGKVAPHKNQAALVHMLSFLPKNFELILVGSADPIYLDYVKLLGRALGVHDRIELLGKIPDRELHRQLQRADAYVSLSRHEGFGVPLIEAMVHRLPVFALAENAVTETLGKSGVHLKTQKPREVAEILKGFFERPDAIKKVIQTQLEHLETLKKTQSSERVQQICRDLVYHFRIVPESNWKDEATNIARQLET